MRSARKVAQIIGCDHSTIDHLLNVNHVERYSSAQTYGKTLYLIKDNKEYKFDCADSAARWLIDNNLIRSKNLKNVRAYLTGRALNKKLYYGYEISYESKI